MLLSLKHETDEGSFKPAIKFTTQNLGARQLRTSLLLVQLKKIWPFSGQFNSTRIILLRLPSLRYHTFRCLETARVALRIIRSWSLQPQEVLALRSNCITTRDPSSLYQGY